jgi:hypothetical protein
MAMEGFAVLWGAGFIVADIVGDMEWLRDWAGVKETWMGWVGCSHRGVCWITVLFALLRYKCGHLTHHRISRSSLVGSKTLFDEAY